MMRRFDKQATSLLIALLLSGLSQHAAQALNPHMRQGIVDYQNGDFLSAAGNLGAALPTDFNNATLHYYMANCYVHLKHMPDAVREFRIAYALDPTGQVGKFSKSALDFLDVEAIGSGLKKKQSVASIEPALDPAMERALAQLDKQSNTTAKQPHSRFGGIKSAADTEPWWMKSQKGTEVHPQLSKYLDSLRKQYESAPGGGGSKQPTEAQKSAENLKGLLQEKHREGKTRLDPNGTNLYTRNYKHAQTETKKTN